jgi:hypothetical protein
MKYDITAYGADPTNLAGSTAAVRAAVAAAKAGGGVIEVPPGTYRVNAVDAADLFVVDTHYPVVWHGYGPNTSVFYVDPSVGLDVDLFKWDIGGTAGANVGSRLTGIGIMPNGRLRHAVRFNFTGIAGLYNFLMADTFVLPTGSGDSVHVSASDVNAPAIHLSAFARNNLNRMWLNGIGDSIKIDGGSLSGSGLGCYMRNITGSGNFIMHGVNLTNTDGQLLIDGGVKPVIDACIFEQPWETPNNGTPKRLVHIRNSSIMTLAPTIRDTQIQDWGANPSTPVIVDSGATTTCLRGNRITTRTTYKHIKNSSTGLVIGDGNEWWQGSSLTPLDIEDTGSGTVYVGSGVTPQTA